MQVNNFVECKRAQKSMLFGQLPAKFGKAYAIRSLTSIHYNTFIPFCTEELQRILLKKVINLWNFSHQFVKSREENLINVVVIKASENAAAQNIVKQQIAKVKNSLRLRFSPI